MKKKIAIDLDGVVFDSENLFRVFTEIYDIEENKRNTVINNKERRFQNRYDWSNEKIKDFYEKYTTYILKSSPLMVGVDIVIPKLMEKYDLIIVTARTDRELEVAKDGLNRLGLENVPIFNNDHSKVERLLNENVNFIIDDNSDICINAANNGICALHFKNSACDDINEKNVINVHNWGEIYKYILLNDHNN